MQNSPLKNNISLLIFFSGLLLIWLLLYSNHTANNNRIIPLRIKFSRQVQILREKLQLQYKSTYTILVLKSNNKNNKYLYSFTGNVVNIDTYNHQLTLKNSNGSIYNFYVNLKSVSTSKVQLKTLTPNNGKGGINKYLFNKSTFSNNSLSSSRVTVVWSDNRTLTEIYNSSPSSTNNPIINNKESSPVIYQ